MKKEARFMNICQEMDSKVRGRSSFDLILNEKFQVGYQVMEMDYETEETKTKLNDIHKPSKLEKRVQTFIETILEVEPDTFEFEVYFLLSFFSF